METVEILVYLVVAFSIGFLILGVIISWDVSGLYSSMKNTITGEEEEQKFKTVSKDDFVLEMLKFWKNCGMGEVERYLSLSVKESSPGDELDREFIFLKIKLLGQCNYLRGELQNCGTNEDLIFLGDEHGKIALPKIVRLSCNVEFGKLVLDSPGYYMSLDSFKLCSDAVSLDTCDTIDIWVGHRIGCCIKSGYCCP